MLVRLKLAVLTVFAVAALVGASMRPAQAGVVLSNDFQDVDPEATLNNTATRWYAQGFTTPATLLATESFFGSVTLSLGRDTGSPNPTTPIVQLFSSVFSGLEVPGTLLATLSGPQLTVVEPTTFTYTAPTDIALAPSTNYWIVVSSTGAESTLWYQTEDAPTEQNASGFSYLAARRTTDSGTNWLNSNPGTFAAISVTAVPEPSTVAMLGAGLLCLGGLRARTRQSGRAPAAFDANPPTAS